MPDLPRDCRDLVRRALIRWPFAVAVASPILAGCTPRLDWREARLPNGEIQMLLPGRPAVLTRRINLRDESVEMTMIGAEVDGLAFTVALANGDSIRPAQQRLGDMREQMLRNIAASSPAAEPGKPDGAAGTTGTTGAAGTAVTPPTSPAAGSGATLAIVDDSGRETGRRAAEVVDARGTGQHASIRMQARFFIARGLAAQAVVIGRTFDEEAARQFFDSLRIVES